MCAHVCDAALRGNTVRNVALCLWLVGHPRLMVIRSQPPDLAQAENAFSFLDFPLVVRGRAWRARVWKQGGRGRSALPHQVLRSEERRGWDELESFRAALRSNQEAAGEKGSFAISKLHCVRVTKFLVDFFHKLRSWQMVCLKSYSPPLFPTRPNFSYQRPSGASSTFTPRPMQPLLDIHKLASLFQLQSFFNTIVSPGTMLSLHPPRDTPAAPAAANEGNKRGTFVLWSAVALRCELEKFVISKTLFGILFVNSRIGDCKNAGLRRVCKFSLLVSQ